MIHLIPFFEKFESQKLSGVINYISKAHRKRFLDDLKEICGVLDYPISNLSDDKFEYLRFRDAYNLQDPEKRDDNQKKCQICNGSGKMKKPWGKEGQRGFHYRDITCKDCDGTGIRKETSKSEPPPVYLKFWFNTNGDYLGITKYTHKKPTVIVDKSKKRKAKKVEKWNKVGPVSYLEIKNREKMYINLLEDPYARDGGVWTVATMWIDYGDGERFAIHDNDERQGDFPETEGWDMYGEFSWMLGDAMYHDRMIYRLVPKTDDEKSTEKESEEKASIPPPDPDLFNVATDATLSSKGMAKELTKDAEFALILNLESLKSSEYPKVSGLKKSRSDARSGALSSKKEEEIRTENINRYISNLSSYDPNGDLNQIKSIIPRFFGWNHPTFFLFYGINVENLSGIINRLFQIHRGESIDFLIKEIKDIITRSYSESSRRYHTIVENIQKCKKKAKSDNRDDISEFISKYEILNRSITAYIGKDILKIGDLESTERKIKVIREMIMSGRYLMTSAKGFLNHLSTKEDSLKCSSYEKLKAFMDTSHKKRLLEDMDILIDAISSLDS